MNGRIRNTGGQVVKQCTLGQQALFPDFPTHSPTLSTDSHRVLHTKDEHWEKNVKQFSFALIILTLAIVYTMHSLTNCISPRITGQHYMLHSSVKVTYNHFVFNSSTMCHGLKTSSVSLYSFSSDKWLGPCKIQVTCCTQAAQPTRHGGLCILGI